MNKIVSSTIAALLLAGPAHAGTTLKANLPPVVGYCSGGSCYNAGVLCATNSDCNLGSLSPKSKASLTGDGRLRVQLREVVDAGGLDAAGDYILDLRLVGQDLLSDQIITVKVPVADGKGKAEVDVSAFMGATGEAIEIFSNYLYAPPPNPADCPGDNSTADITTRQGDSDCTAGPIIGTIGIALGGKTKIKSNVAPTDNICSGIYCAYNAESCTTNSDCNFGTLTAKSNATMDGSGLLTIRLKGVVDAAGMAASGDYIMLLSLYGYTATETVTVKVTVTNGAGKVEVDLSSFMVTPNGSVRLTVPRLHTPPAVPASCPGTNSATDIAARQGDIDCLSGHVIGVMGVLHE